ncbi:MAG TPA: FMN-binding negative transcriptional regulator [Legionellaceae bacterium]|nr:FMN-binding negative transcriptional regulator [Legionellaceae bacterium]
MKLTEFVNKNSFATLITYNDTNLQVSQLNLLFDGTDENTLYGHLSLANPQCNTVTTNTKVVAIFSRDVVSSDTYHAAYIYGELHIVDNIEEKKAILDRLVQHNEIQHANPWLVRWDDNRYIQQINAIVVFAFKITRFDMQKSYQLLPVCSNNIWQEKQKTQPKPVTPIPSLVYIPSVFREDNAEQLWRFVDQHPLSLIVIFNSGNFYARYINLTRPIASTRLFGEMVFDDWIPSETMQAFVIVKGPHCYISPRLYSAAASVPTWNYTTVYIEGWVDLFLKPDDATRAIIQFEATHIFGKFKLSQNRMPTDRASIIEHLSASTKEDDKAVAQCMIQSALHRKCAYK